MRQRRKQTIALASISGVLALTLTGCASTKEAVLPQDGPSMKAIYDNHLQALGARDPQAFRGGLDGRPLASGTPSLEGYTREAYNEFETTFPRLPNPTLVMYVFPHLASDERVPVPGYVTSFPMYERVEYALPGEVPSVRAHDRPKHGGDSGPGRR
jgi:conjugative transfer region lipoprotein (TIGR03751 family)